MNTITTTSTSEKKHKTRPEKFHRSYSQPSRLLKRNAAKESSVQKRKLSRSLTNLKRKFLKIVETPIKPKKLIETTWKYEDEDDYFEYEETKRSSNTAKSMHRDPFKRDEEPASMDETPVRYEVDKNRREDSHNAFDVFEYMMELENSKPNRIFPHLQPKNLKPFGSNENLFFPMNYKKQQKIVYPIRETKSSEKATRSRYNDVQYKQYSSYNRTQKEYPGYEESKKFAVCEKKSAHRKYSTTTSKEARNTPRRSFLNGGSRSKITLSTTKSFTRKSSTSLLKKPIKKLNTFTRRTTEELLKQNGNSVRARSKTNLRSNDRFYNTSTKDPVCKIDDYVTVKLGELQEECRRVKKCKPKKINFGKLPKMPPPDCPCFEEPPLKEGTPLNPLKKRYEPKDLRNLNCDIPECTTPRADANYKIKMKTLPLLELQDCPCEERVLKDFRIKRLPKKKVPEPPKVCNECVGEECCPDRADRQYTIKKKVLPKLKINTCPCIEPEMLKDVPLKRMKPMERIEPPKLCPKIDECLLTPRADANLEIKQKSLPILKPTCICIEAKPIEPAPRLRRMKKIKYIEKPKPDCNPRECHDAIRADDGQKLEKKKLPKFIPQHCPCLEEEMPTKGVKLRRLKMRHVPKEKDKICPALLECSPRADDGLVMKPKQLPQLKLYDCPCVEYVMKTVPPLKRLVPKPVPEPNNECAECIGDECCPPRSDDGKKVQPKRLPALSAGNCPCIEEEPMKNAKPLAQLKKRPVFEKPKICPDDLRCDDNERADDGREVKAKKLPKFTVSDCPCVEAPEPEDVQPLTRLKKVHIPEPCKVCPRPDDCDETPRADEDDWMYWKRCEVAPPPCPGEPSWKGSRRSYSTTCAYNSELQPLKYEVSDWTSRSGDGGNAYNLMFDLNDSPPKIFTHETLEALTKSPKDSILGQRAVNPIDYVAFAVCRDHLGITSSKSSLRDGKCKSANYTDVSALFNTINRMISTYSIQYQANDGKNCECPPHIEHLQPKNPIIKPKENFLVAYPDDATLETAASRSSLYERVRKDSNEKCDEDLEAKKEKALCEMKENLDNLDKLCHDTCKTANDESKQPRMSLWERIVNYFKARPDCPSPEEFKKLRLKEDAEKAASKAGLCLYDPKEMLRKNEKDLPKVITAGNSCSEQCSKK